ADLRARGGHSMSAMPDATLTQSIAALRAQGTSDLLPAILAEASNAQAMIDELGALLGLPVLRMHALATWQPRFDELAFTECARRTSTWKATRRDSRSSSAWTACSPRCAASTAPSLLLNRSVASR